MNILTNLDVLIDGATSAYIAANFTDIDHTSRTIGTGTPGTTDTYTLWGDVGETVVFGTFTVHNGIDGVDGVDGLGAGDMLKAVYDTTANGIVDNAEAVNGFTVGENVASGLQAEVTANTAKVGITPEQAAAITANSLKVSNVDHPLVQTAVPLGAVFTDTVYDDTAISVAVALNTAKISNVTTDLSTTTTATTVTVVSSDGTNALLPQATASVAGVLSGADKTKIDSINTITEVL